MGVDFEAVIGHRLSASDLPTLLQRLDALNPTIADLWPSALPGHRPRYNPDLDEPWRVSGETSGVGVQNTPEIPVWLTGSRGITIEVCRRAIIFDRGDRWSTFNQSAEVRQFLRSMSRMLADVLGVRRALYVPDAYHRASDVLFLVRNGASVEEAEAWLLKECGPPRSLKGITADDDSAERSSYFVDHFDEPNPQAHS